MAEAAATPAAAPGGQVDPYRAYNFKLLINGVTNGHFTEVSGMEVSIARMAYKDGPNDSIRFVPGQVDYEPVVLHFGLTASRELWDWTNSAVQGRVSRRNVSIVLMDAAGTAEVLRWNLLNAWPCRWRGAHLHTLGQEIAIESIALAYERLELESGSGAAPKPA
jgi:phage tail-like protein